MKKLEVSHEVETAVRIDFLRGMSMAPQTLKTIGGNLAHIFITTGGGDCPWLGAYYASDQVGGEWIPCAWTTEGKILSMSKSGRTFFPLDLDILEEQPQFA